MFWHNTSGATLSVITISNEQVCVPPLPSVTSKVFVVVPTGKALPLGNPAVCITSPPPLQAALENGVT